MHFDFPYPGYSAIAPFDVPDTNLMGLFSPRALKEVNEADAIRAGIEKPIGAPRLSEAVKGSKSVLILIDDGTRETPVARLLPAVLFELHKGGISDDKIEFLQAPGTHRPMKEDELKKKLGPAYGKCLVTEYRVGYQYRPATS